MDFAPYLLVVCGCLVFVLIVLMLQMRSATMTKFAEMEKRMKLLEAKVKQHDEELAHLRDQIQHQEPVNPLASFITSAVAAITGMKMGKAMLPAIGLAALKTFSGHLIPRIGKRGPKALPKK